jgi:uncharacterized protein YcfJ
MRFMSKLFTLALMIPAAGFAQTAPTNDVTASAGSRVRVAAPVFGTRKQVGTVVSLTPDTVVLRLGAETASHSVGVREITSLEVTRGQHSQKARGALWGTVIGAGLGGVLGYSLYKEPTCQNSVFGCINFTVGPTSRGSNAAVSAVGGGVLGALIGTLVGNRKTDTWVPGAFATR